MIGSLAHQSYWDTAYETMGFSVAAPADPLRELIERQVCAGRGDCLEVGCFPGRYLSVIGGLGYELSGIDLTPRTSSDLPRWLSSQGHRVGEFHQADFMTFDFRRRFDLVCSFGFIEHFAEWELALRRHAALVGPGGRLIVTVPNFRGGVQYWLHRALDEENLRRHNVAAMNPAAWNAVLAELGFTIDWSGYFGRFAFWVDEQPRNRLQRAAVRTVRTLSRALRALPYGHPSYTPYAGVVATRAS
ncbi:MAG: glycosyl transferase group 1 [Gemmatimonadetes bacterium]|nr:glycosyl transferase group 1 [Gemmatimonadota bacterium]